MWLYNVARQLVKQSRFNLKPLIVPQGDNEAVQMFNSSLDFPNELDFLVLKIHTILLKPGMPNSKIITTHRDPRDVVVSFMEFMNVEFEKAINAAKTLMPYTERYKSYDKDYLTLIPYRDIENSPFKVVSKLAQFLDIETDEANISAIVKMFDKTQVKKLIDETDRQLDDKISENLQIDKGEIVRFSETNYRSFNLDTGFQSKHVSNRNTGDWVKVLSRDQIAEIDMLFSDWMDEFGYKH